MSHERITLYTFNLPHEAYIIRGKLESEGISCFLLDELTVQTDHFYSNALNGVKLQVYASDYELAKEIMREGGFFFDEENEKDPFLLKFKIFTDKIPLFNKIDFLWRFLIMLTLLIIIILGIIYLFQYKSVDDLLTQDVWQIDQISVNDSLIIDPDPKTGEKYFLHIGYGQMEFLESGILSADLYWETDVHAFWKYSHGIVYLSGFKGENAFLNREYQLNIGEDLITMSSQNILITGHHRLFQLRHM